MPKLGMEPLRRAALIDATIAELGASGSLDVTVSQIARRAGVSSALAFHYFGDKDEIFAAAMRHILSELRREILQELLPARTPVERVHGIIAGCFSHASFEPNTINAWMLLYGQARQSAKAARLLSIYHHRLRANLLHALRALSERPKEDAETLAALIDGLYLRAALGGALSMAQARRHAMDVCEALLAVQDEKDHTP